MMQVMCSKDNKQRCDGSCDEPNCMMKHPPTITTWCGSCNELRAQIESLTREKAELQEKLTDTEQYLHVYSTRAHAERDNRIELEQSVTTLRAELDAAKERIAWLEEAHKQLERYQKYLLKAEGRIAELEKENADMLKLNADMDKLNGEAATILDKLQDELDAAKEKAARYDWLTDGNAYEHADADQPYITRQYRDSYGNNRDEILSPGDVAKETDTARARPGTAAEETR